MKVYVRVHTYYETMRSTDVTIDGVFQTLEGAKETETKSLVPPVKLAERFPEDQWVEHHYRDEEICSFKPKEEQGGSWWTIFAHEVHLDLTPKTHRAGGT